MIRLLTILLSVTVTAIGTTSLHPGSAPQRENVSMKEAAKFNVAWMVVSTAAVVVALTVGVTRSTTCFLWEPYGYDQLVMTHKGPRLSGASYDICCRRGVEHEEVCANVSLSCCDLVMEGGDHRLVFFNIGANDGGSVGKFLDPHDHPRSVISAIVIHEVLAGASRDG
ncbi:hypothetical protein FOZ62_028739, partial [Perkinsus olseni]